MAKKKYYAVITGQRPGIYTDWPTAQAQVKGYPGAKYKGFATRAEAETWIKFSATGSSTRKNKDNAKPPVSAPIEKVGEVVIYTDGGALNNPGPGGYGIVQIYNGKRKEISGGFRLTTNNRMELTACIVALRKLEYRDKSITLYSDSSYVVNGINKSWAKSWRRRGWVKADRKPAVNPDLWSELLDLVEGLDISFKWVKGHSGNPMNERCDELAVASAKRKGLPIDSGYTASSAP